MTLTELRYIVAVARERHFGRAAAACFVSQPTLSVAVRRLEQELGVVLFERHAGEVMVTPIGRRVIEQAQQVLEQADTLLYMAAQARDELTGVLRLGVIYTIGPYVLPPLIPLLRQRAPQMPLHIEENYTHAIHHALKQGHLDLLVLSLPFDEQGIFTEVVYEEPFVVLMPKGHPLEAKIAIQPTDLARKDLLLLGPGHCFRDQVLQLCPECRRSGTSYDTMQKTLEGGSLETIRLMVFSGLGITVLPKTSVYGYTQPNELVSIRPFEAPVPMRQVALVWRKSFPRPQAVQVVAQALRECVQRYDVRLLKGSPSLPHPLSDPLSERN